jgi:3-polyprenyl-4-hydroxybenzoate decarboxylase
MWRVEWPSRRGWERTGTKVDNRARDKISSQQAKLERAHHSHDVWVTHRMRNATTEDYLIFQKSLQTAGKKLGTDCTAKINYFGQKRKSLNISFRNIWTVSHSRWSDECIEQRFIWSWSGGEGGFEKRWFSSNEPLEWQTHHDTTQTRSVMNERREWLTRVNREWVSQLVS